MTSEELLLLPPGEKKVAAKVFSEVGYSARKIEQLLGIDHNTAWRASQQATPDELRQFETDFKAAIQEMKNQGIVLVQKRLLQLIPRERRMDQLVKAGEYLEGKTNTTLQQFNADKIEVVSYKDK